jgi:16S rRNA (guanine1207-N2)-methyltransferase
VIHVTLDGADLKFETAPGLFSPDAIDAGTLAMLSCVTFEAADKVLDLGCGYGVVGVVAALTADPGQVWLTDVDPAAVAIAARNLKANDVGGATALVSDGFGALRETGFSKILSNPPYHADFSVPKHFIEKGFNRLAIGGSLWMVTKRDAWYRNKLTAVFGGVKVRAIGGYFVFEATKRSASYANAARRER